MRKTLRQRQPMKIGDIVLGEPNTRRVESALIYCLVSLRKMIE